MKFAEVDVKTFVRSIGDRKIKHRIAAFKKRGWRAWLDFRLDLEDLRVVLGYDGGEDAMENFSLDIQQLVTGDDLKIFNAALQQQWDNGHSWVESVECALAALASRHCPVGTRDDLIYDLQQLKKDRDMTVAEYSDRFSLILRKIELLPGVESGALTHHEQRKYYCDGMPIEWQQMIYAKKTCPATMGDLHSAFQRLETAGKMQPKPREQLKRNGKRKRAGQVGYGSRDDGNRRSFD